MVKSPSNISRLRVSVFGNPDLALDAMPIALLPELRKRFPGIEFMHQDPNEDCFPPGMAAPQLRSGHSTPIGSKLRADARSEDHERPRRNVEGVEWWIIDAVKGIDRVRLITEADLLEVKKRLSMHDYDLGMHLTLLKKIHPELRLRIIGVPIGSKPDEVMPEITRLLANIDRS